MRYKKVFKHLMEDNVVSKWQDDGVILPALYFLTSDDTFIGSNCLVNLLLRLLNPAGCLDNTVPALETWYNRAFYQPHLCSATNLTFYSFF